MSQILRIIFPIALFLIPNLVGADEEIKKFKTTVRVIVEANDEGVRREISSFIKRELRSLNDVEISETNPYWKISIIGKTIILNSNHKAGVALSIVFLRYDSCLENYELPDLYIFESQGVSICPMDNLRKACENIIIDFDTKYVEKHRRMYNTAVDVFYGEESNKN